MHRRRLDRNESRQALRHRYHLWRSPRRRNELLSRHPEKRGELPCFRPRQLDLRRSIPALKKHLFPAYHSAVEGDPVDASRFLHPFLPPWFCLNTRHAIHTAPARTAPLRRFHLHHHLPLLDRRLLPLLLG